MPMLPIIVRTRGKIFRHYTGFSFFVFVWISDLEQQRDRLIRHERIHFLQQAELLFVFHWLLYASFYLISRLKGLEHYIAYRYNPFEEEAYENDLDINYCRTRRPFSWLRYMGKYRGALRGKLPSGVSKKQIGFD